MSTVFPLLVSVAVFIPEPLFPVNFPLASKIAVVLSVTVALIVTGSFVHSPFELLLIFIDGASVSILSMISISCVEFPAGRSERGECHHRVPAAADPGV